jgi:hypothetical protein
MEGLQTGAGEFYRKRRMQRTEQWTGWYWNQLEWIWLNYDEEWYLQFSRVCEDQIDTWQ